ncbi:MAG: radical SAM protein [bacterium]
MPNLITSLFKTAYFRYKRSAADRVRPWFINFITTFKCNSRCEICGIWNKYISMPQKAKEELSLSEIREFLLRNKEFLRELRHIGLTGGEPFLREDIVEVVRSIREILPHVKTGIQTNGLVQGTKEKISQILKFYPEFSLAVSLDGIAGTHDTVRGIRGAFEKALDLVKFAKQLGVPVTSGMTLNAHNYSEIKQVKSLADSLGAEFSCFLPERAGYFNNEDYADDLDSKMRNEISNTLREMFGYHYYMDNLRLLMEKKKARGLNCYSGYASLVINPYGEVKPCVLIDESFGNIKEERLDRILSSSKAVSLRKKIKGCSCWCQCEVSASAVVDPWDVINWFLFRCRDKRGFLKELKQKINRI